MLSWRSNGTSWSTCSQLSSFSRRKTVAVPTPAPASEPGAPITTNGGWTAIALPNPSAGALSDGVNTSDWTHDAGPVRS